MDLDYIQTAVARLFEGSQTAPDSTTEDWAVRTSLANRAIRRWENVEGMRWRELWTLRSTNGGGDSTVVASTATYDTPSNFREPGGWVQFTVGSTTYHYPVIPLDQVQLHTGSGNTDQFCYFTGDNSSGWTLHIHPTPTSASDINGATIDYPYYQYATELSTGTDIPEMSDPDMIIYFIQSELLNQQKDREGYLNARGDSEEALKAMQIRNDTKPPFQEQGVEDQQKLANIGFGS